MLNGRIAKAIRACCEELQAVRHPKIALFLVGVALAGVCIGVANASLDAATASSAVPWPTARPDRLANCPDVLVLKPLEGRTYIFAVGTQAETVAFIDAIFITQKRSYEMTFPALRIDRPSEASRGTYRSRVMTIEAPPDERILGASVSSVGTSCGAAHAISPSLAGIVPLPWLSQIYGPLDAGVSADSVPASAVVPKPIPGSGPQPCDKPFAAAAIDRATEPVYPQIAIEQGATGSAIVRVEVDAFGKAIRTEIYQSAGSTALDVSAANAAVKSTYSPALFACRPDSGAVLFRAAFTAQR